MRDYNSWLISVGCEGPGGASKTSIYDPPPQREKPAMMLDERLKLQKDLTAARDRHSPNAKDYAAPPAQLPKP